MRPRTDRLADGRHSRRPRRLRQRRRHLHGADEPRTRQRRRASCATTASIGVVRLEARSSTRPRWRSQAGHDLIQTVHPATTRRPDNVRSRQPRAFNRPAVLGRSCASASAFYNARNRARLQRRAHLPERRGRSAAKAAPSRTSRAAPRRATATNSPGSAICRSRTWSPIRTPATRPWSPLTDDGTNGQVYFYFGEKQATGNAVEKAGLIGGIVLRHPRQRSRRSRQRNPLTDNNESNATTLGGDYAVGILAGQSRRRQRPHRRPDRCGERGRRRDLVPAAGGRRLEHARSRHLLLRHHQRLRFAEPAVGGGVQRRLQSGGRRHHQNAARRHRGPADARQHDRHQGRQDHLAGGRRRQRPHRQDLAIRSRDRHDDAAGAA